MSKDTYFYTLFEGFGIPMVEAMNCGTPIIAANSSCLLEIAQDAALYCDPFNINEIAEKMESVIRNSELKGELARKSLEHSKFFNRDSAAGQIWQEIEILINQKIEKEH